MNKENNKSRADVIIANLREYYHDIKNMHDISMTNGKKKKHFNILSANEDYVSCVFDKGKSILEILLVIDEYLRCNPTKTVVFGENNEMEYLVNKEMVISLNDKTHTTVTDERKMPEIIINLISEKISIEGLCEGEEKDLYTSFIRSNYVEDSMEIMGYVLEVLNTQQGMEPE